MLASIIFLYMPCEPKISDLQTNYYTIHKETGRNDILETLH